MLNFQIIICRLMRCHHLLVSIHHPSICLIHLSHSPPLRLTHSSSSLSLQERSNHSPPSPTSTSSTFYYSLDQESQHPQSSSSSSSGTASAGAQPNAGHAPPGQLPGPPPMEAERRPVGGDAPAFGTLPPLPAGDGAAFKVTTEEELQWRSIVRISQLGLEEVNRLPTEDSDMQLTLI